MPCPACSERWVLEEQDEAEKRRNTVRIEYAEGRALVASCHAAECEKLWVGWEQLTMLGVTLNATQDREVLAAWNQHSRRESHVSRKVCCLGSRSGGSVSTGKYLGHSLAGWLSYLYRAVHRCLVTAPMRDFPA